MSKGATVFAFPKTNLKRTHFPELNEVIIQEREKVKETFN